MTERIKRWFCAEPHAPAAARRALEALRGVDQETLAKLQLIVCELVTNSVRHAGLSANQPIELVVQADPSVIRGHVSDAGVGQRPVLRRPDPSRESGMGLQIVDVLSTRWEVNRDRRTRVSFELARPGA